MNQTALDSALMLAKQKYQLAHEHERRCYDLRREAEELHAAAYASLGCLNASAATVMRRINKDLSTWYTGLLETFEKDRPRHQYDSSPRLEWGKDIGGGSLGFRASYCFTEDATDVMLSAHVYQHRYRFLLTRELSTTKWAEIVRFLESLAESSKYAIEGLLRSGAPCWLDHVRKGEP